MHRGKRCIGAWQQCDERDGMVNGRLGVLDWKTTNMCDAILVRPALEWCTRPFATCGTPVRVCQELVAPATMAPTVRRRGEIRFQVRRATDPSRSPVLPSLELRRDVINILFPHAEGELLPLRTERGVRNHAADNDRTLPASIASKQADR